MAASILEARASNPAAWLWRIATRSIGAGAVRAAAFSPRGDTVVSAGPSGLSRWAEAKGWTTMGAPPPTVGRAVRGLVWSRGEGPLFFGDGALAGKLSATGAYEVWSVPDRDACFLGAHLDEDGTVTLVGERPARAGSAPSGPTVGVIAQISGGRLSVLSDASACVRLRAATRLSRGPVIACGDHGALVRLELGATEHLGSVCAGHLTAIAAVADGGALTVGAGGHALSVSARLQAQLEAVQTTRDLLCLAIAEDGGAWAGAAQARLLRRSGGSWVRMSGDLGVAASVVTIWASTRRVRAVCDDGTVIEGTLT